MSAEEINAILAADRMETSLNIKEFEKKSEALNKEMGKKSTDNTKESARTITITVNNKSVHLMGKPQYCFVDILDFYPFDTASIQGTRLVQKVNGKMADFFTPVSDGDEIALYWEK